MNGWNLTKEVREEWREVIENHINKIQNCDLEEENPYDVELNLSNTSLNPYTLGKLLEELGWVEEDFDHNGWEFDFWGYYSKNGYENRILMRGCGMTFSLFLSGEDD